MMLVMQEMWKRVVQVDAEKILVSASGKLARNVGPIIDVYRHIISSFKNIHWHPLSLDLTSQIIFCGKYLKKCISQKAIVSQKSPSSFNMMKIKEMWMTSSASQR